MAAARPDVAEFLRCPRCGGAITLEQIYCSQCGVRLTTVLANYGSDAEYIGERKHVTILFADIAGSTALIHGLDPEQSASIIDPVLRKMTGIVQRQFGFVARLTGDGIKAVFGVPTAREDHAERACMAALAIRDVGQSERLRVRVGVNSGEVMVRPLQPGVAGGYDAVGMEVHVAARLEQTARPGSISISATTAHLVAGRFRLRRVGTKVAKGVRDGIPAYQLLCVSGKTRWSVRVRRGLTKFVGRTTELKELLGALHGSTPVVSVVGEAGSGKSRLIFELLRHPDLATWTILKAEVEPDDKRAGLRPFARMLRVWWRIGRNDPPERVRAKVGDRLKVLGWSELEAKRALEALLDLSAEDSAYRTQHSAIVGVLRELIARQTGIGPIIFVVEDAHWLDDDVLHLLHVLSSDAERDKLVIVITSRTPSQLVAGDCQRISLAPLSIADSYHLLDAALGSDPALAEMKTRVVERADGIPLFLEEMAKFVARSPPDNGQIAIPDTVHALIGERVDQLPVSCRGILRIAAAIGRELPVSLLCHLSGRDEAAIQSELRILVLGGFISLEFESGDQQLVFCHALIRDVAYAGLLKSDRRPIHAGAIQAYEALFASRLDEHLETLGHHAIEAHWWDKARFYLRRAAQKAIDRSTHNKAIRFVLDALHALAQSNVDGRTALEAELDLRLLLRTSYNAIGNYREKLTNLDRIEILVHSFEQHHLLPSLWVSRASAVLQLGHVDEAVRLCIRARNTAARSLDPDTSLIAEYMLSRTYFYAGRLSASLKAIRRALAILSEQPDVSRHGGGFGSSRVMLLTQLSQTCTCLGDFAEGQQGASDALTTADEHRRSYDIALATFANGMLHYYVGDLEAITSMLERGVNASLLDGAQSNYALLGGLLSYSYLCAGRNEEALASCRHALEFTENSLHHANWPRLFGSMVMYRVGDHDTALRLARAAAATARKGQYRVQFVWSNLILARLYREVRPRLALSYAGRALALSRAMHMQPCTARALLQLGALYESAGRKEEARVARQHGMDLGRAMGLRLASVGLEPQQFGCAQPQVW